MTLRQSSIPSLVAVLSLCATISAVATINVTIQGDLLKDQSGVAMPQGGLVLLVASTADNTFSINTGIIAGTSTSLGSFLGADDMIVYRGDASLVNHNGVLDRNVVLDYADAAYNNSFHAGERLALLWFPALTLSSGTLTAGSRFGFYDGGTATAANQTDADFSGVDTSRSWISPADPTSSYNLLFYTKDGTYFADPTVANAAVAGNALGLVTAPEPSSALLLAAAGIGALVRRRRVA